jgi:hypothetical protein
LTAVCSAMRIWDAFILRKQSIQIQLFTHCWFTEIIFFYEYFLNNNFSKFIWYWLLAISIIWYRYTNMYF